MYANHTTKQISGEVGLEVKRFFSDLNEEYAGGTYLFLNKMNMNQRREYYIGRFIEHLRTL